MLKNYLIYHITKFSRTDLLNNTYNSINSAIVDNIALPTTAVSSHNWYLPSVSELQMLQANIGAKLGWKKGAADYWTSTDSSDTQAWIVNGTNGVATAVDKTAIKAIRAIRAF